MGRSVPARGQNVKSNMRFGAGTASYGAGTAAQVHDKLVNQLGWTINDAGQAN